LVIIAVDAGSALRAHILRLHPVRGFLTSVVGRQELAQALGRKDVCVVALEDPHFLAGVQKLGLKDYPERGDGDRVWWHQDAADS
jgi:hypothetical protein